MIPKWLSFRDLKWWSVIRGTETGASPQWFFLIYVTKIVIDR
jgi:hypothetical protein